MFLPVLARAAAGLQRVMGPLRGAYVLLVAAATVLTAASLVLLFETEADGSSIHTFPDALWWAITTVTTVGYGDTYPVTPEGRVVAAALMVVGIALFGVLTAGVAAYFVESSSGEDEGPDKLDEILARLETLERHLKDLDERGGRITRPAVRETGTRDLRIDSAEKETGAFQGRRREVRGIGLEV